MPTGTHCESLPAQSESGESLPAQSKVFLVSPCQLGRSLVSPCQLGFRAVSGFIRLQFILSHLAFIVAMAARKTHGEIQCMVRFHKTFESSC